MISVENALAYARWAEKGAKLFARCTRRQYMAILLSPDGRVVGTGRNGAPAGMKNCTDGGCPRGLTKPGEVAHGSSYGPGAGQCVAVHAEINALMYADRTQYAGGTLIVNGPPCWNCAVAVAGSGVESLVYIGDSEYAEWPEVEKMLVPRVNLLEVLDGYEDRVFVSPRGTDYAETSAQEFRVRDCLPGVSAPRIPIQYNIFGEQI